MQTLSEIKSLLAERGLRPKHRLGQNFLHDQNQIRKLLGAAAVRRGEVILEVGAGTGTLTEALVDAGAEVIACELDRDMAAILRSRLDERVTLIEADILAGKHALNPRVMEAIAGRPFKLVANLPYGVASPLMVDLLVEHQEQCTGQFVTIQKEVAERLLAPHGGKDYGPLSIVVQTLARVELISTLSPSCFWPQPDVTSAMVSIAPSVQLGQPDIAARRAFARFVTQLFAKRRKQIGSVFGRDRQYPAGITSDLRPEALSPQHVVALFESVGEAPGK